MNKLIVLSDKDRNLYVYEHQKVPRLIAKYVTTFCVRDNRIAIIAFGRLYTYGKSSATGSLGTSHEMHPIFLGIDDEVINVVLEEHCLRYIKDNGKTFYCGRDCKIKEGDNLITLPEVTTPQEYFSINGCEKFVEFRQEWTNEFTKSCQYSMPIWMFNNTFFLRIFDGDLYFRSTGDFSDENRGDLIMKNICDIHS